MSDGMFWTGVAMFSVVAITAILALEHLLLFLYHHIHLTWSFI